LPHDIVLPNAVPGPGSVFQCGGFHVGQAISDALQQEARVRIDDPAAFVGRLNDLLVALTESTEDARTHDEEATHDAGADDGEGTLDAGDAH
jgi:hypothetical protein